MRAEDVLSAPSLKYRRILLKLSGEALQGAAGFGIDPQTVDRFAGQIGAIADSGCQVAIVIGAGNIYRGRELTRAGVERVTADQVGMLATIMNCLVMQDALERLDMQARVMSAVEVNEICEDYIRRRAIRHLEKQRIVLFAAGIGNPFFTTDTAAGLRAVEVGAELLIKATRVDGVYSGDPEQDSAARRFSSLSYDQILDQRLGVMDTTAIVLCRDHGIPLRVLDMNRPHALLRAVQGSDEGTLVYAGEAPAA